MDQPIVYFHLFKQTLQFLIQIYMKKVHIVIKFWDWNARPSDLSLLPSSLGLYCFIRK